MTRSRLILCTQNSATRKMNIQNTLGAVKAIPRRLVFFETFTGSPCLIQWREMESAKRIRETTYMISFSKFAILTAAATFGLLATSVNAQGVAHGRFAHRNASGGVSAGRGTVARGANGGAVAHGRVTKTDGQGDVMTAHGTAVRGPNGGEAARGRVTTASGQGQGSTKSGGEFRGPNGAEGSRQGSTQWDNGNVTHQGSEQVTGRNGGSIQSSGNFQKSADGQFSGSRSTTATGPNGGSYNGSTTYQNGSATHTTDVTTKNGATYQGQTTYEKGQGVTHTGTCTNASGETVPCK